MLIIVISPGHYGPERQEKAVGLPSLAEAATFISAEASVAESKSSGKGYQGWLASARPPQEVSLTTWVARAAASHHPAALAAKL